jgi:hypothetical protein
MHGGCVWKNSGEISAVWCWAKIELIQGKIAGITTSENSTESVIEVYNALFA